MPKLSIDGLTIYKSAEEMRSRYAAIRQRLTGYDPKAPVKRPKIAINPPQVILKEEDFERPVSFLSELFPLETIIHAVSQVHNERYEDVISKEGFGPSIALRKVTDARFHAIFLVVKLRPDLRLKDIGKFFDGRQIQSIMQAIVNWTDIRCHNLKDQIEQVNKLLGIG